MFAQVFEVTMMNLKNLPNRLGSSSVIVVGIGGVVGVMVAILAMAAGFQSTLDRGGDPERAVVLRGGSDNELSSFMDTEAINIVASMPGVIESSPELYMIADVPKRSTGTDANLIVRGVAESGFAVHDEVDIVEGRSFQTGRGEIIAGRGANIEFAGIDIGNTVRLRESEWTIVGIFEADGSAYESELWVDLPVAQSAFRVGGGASSMRLRLDSGDRVDELAELIANDPRLDLQLFGEAEFFARQGGGLTGTIRTFGYAVAIIMAIGAVFAALNTMYAAVVSRTVEIATLRALGFGRFPVVVSVMIESMALALLGGLLGAAVSYFGFNGYTVSTLSNASFSQIAFDFAVTPELLRDGLVWALGLGAIGGLLPAIRAALLPITVALRGE